jgi:hypothetical protein
MNNGTATERAAWVARVRQLEADGFRVWWSTGVEMTSPITLGLRVYILATCGQL